MDTTNTLNQNLVQSNSETCDAQEAHAKVCAQWQMLHDTWRQNVERLPQYPESSVPRYEYDSCGDLDYVLVAQRNHVVLVYSRAKGHFTLRTILGLEGRVVLDGFDEDYKVEQFGGPELYLQHIIGWGFLLQEAQRDQYRAALEMYQEALPWFGFSDPSIPIWARLTDAELRKRGCMHE